MMSSKKVLVVFGATGGQGGSVIRSVLADPKAASQFIMRGVTRDKSKSSAQALAAKGVEMVNADMDDPESIHSALKGAHAVFAVTNFWEKASYDIELQQGKTIADACKEHGVQHLVWSSLVHAGKTSGGKFTKIAHFDSKADVEEYIKKLGVPATFFLAGFFMSNLPSGMLVLNPETKEYMLALPTSTTTPFPMIDHEKDTGAFVKAILLNREKLLGKQILGAANYWTPEQIVEEFKNAQPELAKGAKAVEISPKMFTDGMAKTGAPEAIQDEMLENVQFIGDFGYYGGLSLDESLAIVTEPLTTWKEYISKYPPGSKKSFMDSASFA